jgi:putative acetyltransferase
VALDITIRPETPADHDAIAAVVGRAFGSPAEPRLVEAIRASSEYLAELALVATVDGTIVGHVMISGCRLVAQTVESGDDAGHDHGRDPGRDTGQDIVMLSPLSVDPDVHGRGVGSELVRSVTALADRRGEPLVVLEGDPRYYTRFGFEPAAGHGITMPIPDWAPPEAAQVLRLTNDDPALRGRVIYPPSFEVLDGA